MDGKLRGNEGQGSFVEKKPIFLTAHLSIPFTMTKFESHDKSLTEEHIFKLDTELVREVTFLQNIILCR